MRWLFCLLLLASFSIQAEEQVTVCFNYGCRIQADVRFDENQLLVLS